MDLLFTREHSKTCSVYNTVGDRHYCHHNVFAARALQWSCPYGGFLHHNEVRNTTAHLMSDVCHNVGIELTLQPITDERLQHNTANTEDGASVDIKAQEF